MKQTIPSLATQRKALPPAVIYGAGIGLLLSLLLGCGQKGPLTQPPNKASPAAATGIEPASAASAPITTGATPAH